MTRCGYDEANRLSKVTDPRDYPLETEYAEYVHDKVGNKTQHMNLEGHTTYLYCDEMNRLTVPIPFSDESTKSGPDAAQPQGAVGGMVGEGR